MSYTNVFKRYEAKYLITREQQKAILEAVNGYIRGDEYGNSTICNIYYDTDDYLLIRRSIEKPVYKEKLRLRSYGIAKPNSMVFAEIKKKYEGIVYKRRISTTEASATALCKGINAEGRNQITDEILFFVERYRSIEPKVFISYEREAFYDKDDSSFRITFDRNILWRDFNLSLSDGIYGSPLLKKDQVLLEVKCSGAIPLWFVKVLTDNGIYRTNFSKYGRAYEEIAKLSITKFEKTGGLIYA